MEKEYLVLADQLGHHWPQGAVIRDSLLGTYPDTPEGRFLHDQHITHLLERGMIREIVPPPAPEPAAPAQPEATIYIVGGAATATPEPVVEEAAPAAPEAQGEMLPPQEPVAEAQPEQPASGAV